MATRQSTVEEIMGRLNGVGGVTADRMFGEYGIRCEGKIVALICGDQLFVKPTAPGRELAGGVPEVPPYPGAKPSLLIGPERWGDTGWLMTLIRATADALPSPPVKRKKAARK